jgi:hypothetical protein
MEAHGLDDETLAAELSTKLGKEIKPGGVKRFSHYNKIPKTWAEALSIPPSNEAQSEEGTDAPQRPSSAPPTAPPGSKMLLPAGDVARERIAQTYGLIGGGISAATGNKGYSIVVDDCAPGIAAAWLKAAEENDFARRVVSLMSAGGATGELVLTHIILVSGLMYVSGVIPFAVNPRWSPLAPVVPVSAASAAGDGGVNGSGDLGSGDPVGQPGQPTSG